MLSAMLFYTGTLVGKVYTGVGESSPPLGYLTLDGNHLMIPCTYSTTITSISIHIL